MIKLCELYSREGLSALRSWMALPITAKQKNNCEKNSDKLLFVSYCPLLSRSSPTKLFLVKSYILVLILKPGQSLAIHRGARERWMGLEWTLEDTSNPSFQWFLFFLWMVIEKIACYSRSSTCKTMGYSTCIAHLIYTLIAQSPDYWQSKDAMQENFVLKHSFIYITLRYCLFTSTAFHWTINQWVFCYLKYIQKGNQEFSLLSTYVPLPWVPWHCYLCLSVCHVPFPHSSPLTLHPKLRVCVMHFVQVCVSPILGVR